MDSKVEAEVKAIVPEVSYGKIAIQVVFLVLVIHLDKIKNIIMYESNLKMKIIYES